MADLRPGHTYPEYHVLEHPAATGEVMIQRLGRARAASTSISRPTIPRPKSPVCAGRELL